MRCRGNRGKPGIVSTFSIFSETWHIQCNFDILCDRQLNWHRITSIWRLSNKNNLAKFELKKHKILRGKPGSGGTPATLLKHCRLQKLSFIQLLFCPKYVWLRCHYKIHLFECPRTLSWLDSFYCQDLHSSMKNV